MPFNRPSLTQLTDRAADDVNARLPGADGRLRHGVLNVLGRSHAGAVHELYGYLDWISRQPWPDQADEEGVRRWAAILDVPALSATPAVGQAQVAGADGAIIPADALMQRLDGVEYRTTAPAEIAGGVALVPIEAVATGATGLAAAGTVLSLVSPVSGIASAASVAAPGLSGGADAEGVEALRGRVLDRLRDPPHGGRASDYVNWAKGVAGVTRVWVYPLMNGLGTVGVAFVMHGRENIIPGPGDVAAVAAAIEEERPVTAGVDVFAPTPDPLDFEITLTPDTPEVRAAVAAELADLLVRDAAPGGPILLSRIREAVSIAAGELNNVVASPSADVAHGAGHLAVMGEIDWGD